MVLCTGARSEKVVTATFPALDQVCFVEVGDFTGIALRRCAAAGMRAAVVVAMVGKITKLADGVMMTHWQRSAVDTQLLERVARETGAPPEAVAAATETATARHLYEVCVVAGARGRQAVHRGAAGRLRRGGRRRPCPSARSRTRR